MKWKILLFLIVLLASVLRFYRVSEIPPSLYWDEVAAGYNAKSILETQKDEYGHKLPLFFQSFDDYKLPGYIYVLTIPIKLLGLNEFSVRLPSILFGILSVFFIFCIGCQIVGRRMGLLSSLFMAVLPISVHFSRVGFEANLALTLFLIGMWMFLKRDKTIISVILGMLFFSLTMYFYNSYRIGIPLIIPFLLVRCFKELGTKKIVISILVFFLMMIPYLVNWSGKSELSRFKQVGVLGNDEVLQKIPNAFIQHRYFVYAQTIIIGYLSHFSYNFFFESGDGNPRHQAGDIGLLYKFLIPFFFLGFYYGWNRKKPVLITLLIIFFLAPIAASLSLPTPHTLRSLWFGPMAALIASFGFLEIRYHTDFRFRRIIYASSIICIIFFMYQYLQYYYFIYPKASSGSWAYGYKQVFKTVKKYEDTYSPIFVTGFYWRPYIYDLFYMGINHSEFQKNPTHSRIGNVYFGHAEYDNTDTYYNYEQDSMDFRKIPNALLILSPHEKRNRDDVIEKIKDPSGHTIFYVVRS